MSTVPGIVSGSQQVLKNCLMNKRMNTPSQSPFSRSSVCEYVRPQTGVCSWGSDFGISSRLAGGCALWFAYLGPPAKQTTEPTPWECRGVTRNLPASTRRSVRYPGRN